MQGWESCLTERDDLDQEGRYDVDLAGLEQLLALNGGVQCTIASVIALHGMEADGLSDWWKLHFFYV